MLSTSPRLIDASNLIDRDWPSHTAEYFLKLWLVSTIRQDGTELEISQTNDGIVRVSARRNDGAIIDVLPVDSRTGKTMECRFDDQFYQTTARIAGISPESQREGSLELRLKDESVKVHVTIASTRDVDTVIFHLNGIDNRVREQATSILAEWLDHQSRRCWPEHIHLAANEKSQTVVRWCIAAAMGLLIILFGYLLIVFCILC